MTTVAQDVKIMALHERAYGEAAIAETLGLRVEAVRAVLLRAGVAKHPHRTRAAMEGPPDRADARLRRF